MKKREDRTKIWAMRYSSELTGSDPNVKVYFRRLDTILSRWDLRNIALTGNRGSGKSSILHSYDNQKNGGRGERFLYISLAEFEHNHEKSQKRSEDETPDGDKEEIQKRLEYSMISQILAKCTSEDLRTSALRAIPEVRETRRWRWFKWLYAFILVTLICGLMLEKQVSALLQLGNWTKMEPELLRAIGYSVAVVMMFIAVSYLISRKPGAFRLGKISFKGSNVETEIVPSEDVFCLDRYRYDLVYILNQIARDIDFTVVIEDLEFVRDCCAAEIMGKLRELNLLVNTHRLEQYRKYRKNTERCRRWINRILGNHSTLENQPDGQYEQENWVERWLFRGNVCKVPIRFIYAVSDETFNEEERAKFFDTILPVTPTLNIQNSFEVIKNLFTGAGMAQPETQIMTHKISEVVIDHRVLNDIRTEYAFFVDWYLENDPLGKKKRDERQEPEAAEKKSFWNWGRHEKKNEEEQKDPNSKYKQPEIDDATKRQLIAIAVYKALLPYEYFRAFTREGQGLLRNIKTEDTDGRVYESNIKELVNFLFVNYYINAQSLALIGYSLEVLRWQWADILMNGTKEEKRDLLERFDPENEGREKEKDAFKKVLKDREKALDGDVIEVLGKRIFPNAQETLKYLYGKLRDSSMKTEGLVKILICLGSFEDVELENAKQAVNAVAPGENTKHKNTLKNKKSAVENELGKDAYKNQAERVRKVLSILLNEKQPGQTGKKNKQSGKKNNRSGRKRK